MKTDIEISQGVRLRPIAAVAGELGLSESEIDPYGAHKAKIHLDALLRRELPSDTRYVVVTAMTPTPFGEGKTVITIGLGQALRTIGERSIIALRQPSLGPTFGMKGGGAGGGYSQVVPMEELNLHLTGDIHAVGAAHNLLAAAVDARMYHEGRLSNKRLARLGLQRLDLDADTVTWKRAVDVNDRALRNIMLNSGKEGVARESGFDITAASEVMAILALAVDRRDLRQRLGRIVVGLNGSREPVTADDLGVAGAMMALLRDAVMPNLMQTVDGTPALIHAGPFANIAHGNSSILADYAGMRLVEGGFLVTEAGFGADCGFEKHCDVKCRYSGLHPDCAVIVASVRALKHHGGAPSLGKRVAAGDGTDFLEAGLANLAAHIRIVHQFGVPAVVAVNRFPGDMDFEISRAVQGALDAGAEAACACDVWARGGDGGRELAHAVVAASSRASEFRFLYSLEAPLEEKMRTIATRVYGADSVELAPAAAAQIALYEDLGFGSLPVIMAKTPLSLSHDPKRKGVPAAYDLPVRDVRLSAGAGFIYALCGDIMTMPGLSSKPAFMAVDVDEEGQVVGLF